MGSVWWLARPLGDLPAAIIAYGFSLLLTGGFHEDGLADTADALGGATSREKIFLILKDPHVGAFGGLALVTTMLLRVVLLAETGGYGWLALVVSQCVARVPPVYLMFFLPYVTDRDQSKSSTVQHLGSPQLLFATLVAASPLLWAWLAGLVYVSEVLALAGALAMVTTALGRLFRQRAGGITGDFLGASEQVGEFVLLAGLVLILR